mgnify:CR=1 FL=1
MVETKTIILNEQEIIYKIHYKRIKNCYLRVEKGEVVIRCSPLFSQSEIEKLIRNHQEEILEQIKGYVPKYNYQEDGYVYLFNQKYQIVLKDMKVDGQRNLLGRIDESEIFILEHIKAKDIFTFVE